MTQPTEARILTHFATLEDPRDARGKDHLLIDIITITICAVICGAESWVDIELYGQSKRAWLGTFLKLPHGIPSHDTFARVFARLDPEAMQQCFLSWIRAISALSAGEVVAIDGKKLRHSYDSTNGKGAIHMVSAWASENRLVLGQQKVNEKSNEITAIPALLQVLALEGCIVTIDAMGTQKEIATTMIERGADYILALKGNQSGLFEEVPWLFEQAQALPFQDVAPDFAQTIDKGHGRIELRRCWALAGAELDYLVQKPQWRGLNSVVMLQRERRIKGQTSRETHYYISSLDPNAAKILAAIRTHWTVENHLHWVLDVAFDEDACRIRKDHAPQNFSLLRHIALNLLGQDETTKAGIAAKRKKAGWDDDYLLNILSQ